MKHILSLDGGGVRCYFYLRILAEIERQAGCSIQSLFHDFVGVSAGSLIASLILLRKPDNTPMYSMEEILDIFQKESKQIFYWTYMEWIRSGFGIIGSRYNPKYLQCVLQKYFGDTKLNSVSRGLCIISYDILKNKPYYFHNTLDTRKDSELLIKDCICASTSAPTYFPPYRLDYNGSEHLFVDGGVVANNPCEIGFLEVLKHKNDEKNFFLLSLGTGIQTTTCETDAINQSHYGFWYWSEQLLNTLFTADSQEQMRSIQSISQIDGLQTQFCRINIPYRETINLDDCSRFNYMKTIMDRWLLENQDKVLQIIRVLTNVR